MNRILIIIFVLSSGFFGCKKNIFSPEGSCAPKKSKAKLSKVYSNIKLNSACINLTSDNCYIVAGANNETLFVSKIEYNGNLSWVKSYDFKTNLILTSVIQASNSYIILGHKQLRTDKSWNLYRSWIAKIDNVGNLKWQKEIDTIYNRTFNSKIIKKSDNDYLIITNIDNTLFKSEIVRINNNGEIIEKKYFESDFSKMVESNLNEYIDIVDGSILKLDSNFNLISKIKLVSSGRSVIQLDDGFVYLNGNNKIARTDNNGNERWTKQLQMECRKMQIKNGKIYVFGMNSYECSDSYFDNDVNIAILDTTGEIMSEFNFGESDSNEPYDVIIDKNGDFVIVARDEGCLYLIKI